MDRLGWQDIQLLARFHLRLSKKVQVYKVQVQVYKVLKRRRRT